MMASVRTYCEVSSFRSLQPSQADVKGSTHANWCPCSPLSLENITDQSHSAFSVLACLRTPFYVLNEHPVSQEELTDLEWTRRAPDLEPGSFLRKEDGSGVIDPRGVALAFVKEG